MDSPGYSSADEVIIRRPRKGLRLPQAITSPTASPIRPPVLNKKTEGAGPTARKEVFDGVVIPLQSSHPKATARDDAERLGPAFAGLSLGDPRKEESKTDERHSGTVSFKELLAACTSQDVLPFADAFTSDPFLALFALGDGEARNIRKIGEATYSEVFGLSLGSAEIVIKIVPLQSDALEEGQAVMPESSSREDVLREMDVTKRMSCVEGRGFVEFLG